LPAAPRAFVISLRTPVIGRGNKGWPRGVCLVRDLFDIWDNRRGDSEYTVVHYNYKGMKDRWKEAEYRTT
jgi:hypothetical protein